MVRKYTTPTQKRKPLANGARCPPAQHEAAAYKCKSGKHNQPRRKRYSRRGKFNLAAIELSGMAVVSKKNNNNSGSHEGQFTNPYQEFQLHSAILLRLL
jgi:hypothetical protein